MSRSEISTQYISCNKEIQLWYERHSRFSFPQEIYCAEMNFILYFTGIA